VSTGERLPELIGTWRVVRWEDRESEDEAWTAMLPAHVEGYAVYTDVGHWAVQLYAPPSADVEGLHFGYFGFGEAHDVVREDGVVRGVLKVESRGASTPDAMAYNDRPFVIEGDSVVIGDGTTWVRAAERVR
jgi:hypothetical protein